MLGALAALGAFCLAGCNGKPAAESGTKAPNALSSVSMAGGKSVMTFFLTSKGLGKGGDLGGLAGADAHCQSLAKAEGAGDHTWRAYLSTNGIDGHSPVNARDRIGKGPWYSADGRIIARNLEELHGSKSRLDKETAVTERLDPVEGEGDIPNRHEILTGSQGDGTAVARGENLTCGDWTSSAQG